jgi:hypothetical protein
VNGQQDGICNFHDCTPLLQVIQPFESGAEHSLYSLFRYNIQSMSCGGCIRANAWKRSEWVNPSRTESLHCVTH